MDKSKLIPLAVVAVAVIGAGLLITRGQQGGDLTASPDLPAPAAAPADGEPDFITGELLTPPGPSEGDLNLKGEDPLVEAAAGMAEAPSYTGQRLGGNDRAPLLDLNETDYRRALREKKVVALYFYAKWCPICRAEFPKMTAAFDRLDDDRVIGFRVNYNDNDTDTFEKRLASDFGVSYQHTKVFLKDGQRILKSPEGWTEGRYLAELAEALK